MKSRKRTKFKDKLQRRHEILEALASKDKEELRTASYVAYDDIIEFPQPVAFKIKRLKKLLKKLKSSPLKMGL